MSNTADLCREGLLCQTCGTLMDDEKSPGYPRSCRLCLDLPGGEAGQVPTIQELMAELKGRVT